MQCLSAVGQLAWSKESERENITDERWLQGRNYWFDASSSSSCNSLRWNLWFHALMRRQRENKRWWWWKESEMNWKWIRDGSFTDVKTRFISNDWINHALFRTSTSHAIVTQKYTWHHMPHNSALLMSNRPPKMDVSHLKKRKSQTKKFKINLHTILCV